MNTTDFLLDELEEAPLLLEEMLDFICFFKNKHTHKKKKINIFTESDLNADWLKPENDNYYSCEL